MFTKHIPALGLVLLVMPLCGCGTTKSKLATEQLIVSDAVDRAVARINFRPLSHRRVYLDTQYLKSVKGMGFVNADYIISSLRQQMVAASCLLEDKKEDAELIVEARVGALGRDSHDMTYGIPPSSSLSSAASLVPNAPSIPTIPEISLARKSDEIGAAKIAVFAYHRETKLPVWQSGISQSKSTAKDTWVFGAGPFQSGTVRGERQLAGERIPIPLIGDGRDRKGVPSLETYGSQVTFVPDLSALQAGDNQVQQANFEQTPPAPVTTPPQVTKPASQSPPAAPKQPAAAPKKSAAKPVEEPTKSATRPAKEPDKKLP
jgi:hypothetical protein